MTDLTNKAVFLSYASQDGDAARRICEALRAAGVEVWFDQSELRGGDAWDAKIRKQIKECALFVPIISANTQARQEGYFRLEWRLADQRTHLMSHDRAFIVPVVVDRTPDQGARVPESFLAVQWTRLSAGEPDVRFVDRVREMLSIPPSGGPRSPEAAPVTNFRPPASRAASAEASAGHDSTTTSKPEARRRDLGPPAGSRKMMWLGAAVSALVIVGFVALRPTQTKSVNPEPKTQNPEPPAAAAAAKSLAVLPLENLSPDPENAFFTDGVHSEIISTLLRLSDLKVVSRSSVLAFKGSPMPLAEIGQKLGVENVITGSVRRAGDQVRIQLELRRARDEALLWTQDYNRALKDVFAVQSEIADQVARVLQARESRTRIGRAEFMSKNPRAYELYLKVQELRRRPPVTIEREKEAARMLDEVLALDPEFEPAAVTLSSVHVYLYTLTTDPAQQLTHAAAARHWAETAARLMPGGTGDRALAYYYCRIEPDAARAVALAENAVRAMPNDPGNHNILAIALLFAGRVSEAAAEFRIGLGDDGAAQVQQNLINALARLRRAKESNVAFAQLRAEAGGREYREQALADRFILWGELPADLADLAAMSRIQWVGRAREFERQLVAIEAELAAPGTNDVDRVSLLLLQADASRRLGREAAAGSAARTAVGLAEELQPVAEFDRSNKDGRWARVLSRVGRPDEAIAAAQRYVGAMSPARSARIRWSREIELAELYAYLNRPRECVELLAPLLRVPSGITVPMLRVDPVWDNVRNDAGFKALLADPKNSAPL